MQAPPDWKLPVAPNFTALEIAECCRKWGAHLWLPKTIPGAQLLWALSGCESSFGANCAPRHELAYCTGSFSRTEIVQKLTKSFAHAAHASFGPWQLLLVNASPFTTPADLMRLDRAALETVGFINKRILKHEGATTVAQVAGAYNSGDWRTGFVPEKYVRDCEAYMLTPMPAGQESV